MPRVPTRDNLEVLPAGARIRGASAPVADLATPRTVPMATPRGDLKTTVLTPEISPGLRSGVTPEVAATGLASGQAAARAVGRFAEGLGEAGGALGRIAQSVQDQTNRRVVDDLETQVKQDVLALTYGDGKDGRPTGFVNVKGANVLAPYREDKRPMADAYLEDFDKRVAERSKMLTNPAQRMAFDERISALRTSFAGSMAQHSARQYDEWNKAVLTAKVETNQEIIRRQYADPEARNSAVQAITDAISEQALANGLPADAAALEVGKAVSAAHSSAVLSAMEDGNYGFADAYLNEMFKRGQIVADDALRLRAQLDSHVDDAIATQAVNQLWSGHVAPQQQEADNPLNLDRLVQITMNAGEGTHGRERDASGALITSPKGAQGSMQVMPYTSADPGYGVKPARDDSDAERARVGRDYYKAMLREYGGDPAKAWAAYNAGPGRLNAALERSRKEGGPWVSYLPKETRDYVDRCMKALGGNYGMTGGAARQRPVTLTEGLEALRSNPTLAARPERLAKAETQFTRLFNAQEHDRNQREQDTLGRAYSWLSEGKALKDFPGGIPPEMGDKLPGLLQFEKAMASGETRATDENLYADLISNPAKLVATDLRPLLPRFTPNDYEHLVEKKLAYQAQMNKGDDSAHAQVQSDMELLKGRLAELGVDTSPNLNATNARDKARAQGDQAKINAATRLFQTRLDAFEKNTGRKATPKERQELVDGLFAPVPHRVGSTWDGKPVIENRPLAFVGLDPEAQVEIPAADRARMVQAYRQQFGRDPTDSALRRLYLAGKLSTMR